MNRLKEADRMKLIVKYLKTGEQPEGYTVRENEYGVYRVTANKKKDIEAEREKKRQKLIKKLIEMDPTLSEKLGEPKSETTETVEEVETETAETVETL